MPFEENPYKVDDELYVGCDASTYSNANITHQIKAIWRGCGLDKGCRMVGGDCYYLNFKS